MKRLNLLVLFAILVAGLNSCSKERKIEKNLYSKGGDWEVTQYIYTNGSMNPAINSYETKTYSDCGTFHFAKDGSGTVTLNLDGDSFTESFTYSNTEKELSINYNGGMQVYNIDWKKDVLSLDYDDSSTDQDGYLDADRESLVMSKK